MSDQPTPSLRERNRQQARDMVLDAATRLLIKDASADFSMRALAAEAGMGFATPFNHFGSKNAIMQALSTRLIGQMAAAFERAAPVGDAIDRVTTMGRIAVALLLEQPDVYKAVVGSLGVVGPAPTEVMGQSQALWTLALGAFDGIADDVVGTARKVLAEQLAFGFRGCLSFWIAGEVANENLAHIVETNLSTTLLGFADGDRRQYLRDRIAAFRGDGG